MMPLPHRARRTRPAARQRQHGALMLEMLIAILVLAIGLIGTLALQVRATAAVSDSAVRAEAAFAGERLLALMNNDQANLDEYAVAAGAAPSARLAGWHAQTMAAIPNARIAITVTPVAGTTRNDIALQISWQRRTGDMIHRHLVNAYIARSE